MTYADRFRAALDLVARAAEALERRGLKPPVVVGGAAAEIYSGGEIASSDFDLVTAHQLELLGELRQLGFTWQVGNVDRMVVHPTLGYVVEVVSPWLMDGRADSARVRRFEIGRGLAVDVIGVEDLIADRMGQAFSRPFGGPPITDRRNQALRLFQIASGIAPGLDAAYLDRRIREETVNSASLETLQRWNDDDRDHQAR
ncbi:MAG: hypothetical protein IPK81_21520 [Rhodospirillales bacterium]|nr:MAG: hypothetical protein IPK81_21520 [Rhodospirillales bacterium]